MRHTLRVDESAVHLRITGDRYHDARIEAAHELRTSLPLEERLELVTIFHELCMADDVLEQAELLVLREAAEALGLDVRQLSRHLRDLKG